MTTENLQPPASPGNGERLQVLSGYATGLLYAWLTARGQEEWVRECVRIWVWGALLPLVVVASAYPTRGLSAALLLAYPVVAFRAARWRRRCGDAWRTALLYGGFCTIAKWAELSGQCKFLAGRLAGARVGLIEYKTAAAEPRRAAPESR